MKYNNGYIKENNKVKECRFNISRMSVWEHVYYSIFHWNYFGKALREVFFSVVELFKSFINVAVYILGIIFFPILLIAHSILNVEFNKKSLKYKKKRYF